MPRGIKSASTNKQKRQVRHNEVSANERGYFGERAAQRGYETAGKQDHVGKKSGRVRSRKSTKTSNRAGGAASRGGHARAGRAAHRR